MQVASIDWTLRAKAQYVASIVYFAAESLVTGENESVSMLLCGIVAYRIRVK